MVDRIEPLTTTVAASLDAPRFAAAVVTGFASLAMVLAAVGLYGVLSYSVSQRVRELAIRAALGAQRADLVYLVLREGLSVTLAGIALGVLGAGLFTRLMQDLLFGVTPLDPIAFTVGAGRPRRRVAWRLPRAGAARRIAPIRRRRCAADSLVRGQNGTCFSDLVVSAFRRKVPSGGERRTSLRIVFRLKAETTELLREDLLVS